MQIADQFTGGSLPPSGGGAADVANIERQLRRQRARHRRIYFGRTFGMWWYRALLIFLAVIIAIEVGAIGYFDIKVFVGVTVGIILFFAALRRVEFGIVLAALAATPLVPPLGQIKSLQVHAIELLLIALLFTMLIQTAFGARKPVLPSLWSVWAQVGLIIMAFISTIFVQFTWTPGVPHKINTNPILFDEIYGVIMYFVPLMTIVVTTAALSNKGSLIQHIQSTFLLAAFACAIVLIARFKSVGVDLYTFRFAEPSIGYMSLRALAQILALGAMIGYARFLYATLWRTRWISLGMALTCLLAIYFSLENSWWLETALALIVITLMFSRRLILFFLGCAVPLLPLLKYEIDKLSQVKSADYYRLIIWQDSLRVWRKQPWLGVGAGDFWTYDQRYTQLPMTLHNCNKTGLCVAHNGYLQLLGELGPMGPLLILGFIATIIVIGILLFRRSQVKKMPVGRVVTSRDQFRWLVSKVDLHLYADTPERQGRILAVICVGLVVGSAVGDFFSGSFFLQPRQIGSAVGLPQVITSWIMWGCLIYKDKIWRVQKEKVIPEREPDDQAYYGEKIARTLKPGGKQRFVQTMHYLWMGK